jgi:hypothetical protein
MVSAEPKPLDGIAATSLSSTAMRTNSLPCVKRGYVDDICGEMRSRTKPEGANPETPGPVRTAYFLLLTELVRCREGQTADDAVLTLILPDIQTGAAFAYFRQRVRDWRIAQLTNRRIRTFITRPIARKTNKVAEPP